MLRGATITGDTAGEITLNVKGAENQTAALLNVQDNGENDHLNIDKDGVTTLSSLVATTADINAGTVDAVIGGTTPAAGTFTTLTANTGLTLGTATIAGPIINGFWSELPPEKLIHSASGIFGGLTQNDLSAINSNLGRLESLGWLFFCKN